MTPEQVKLLKDWKIEPQKVIAFETTDEKVTKELAGIKIHEQSGKRFTPEEIELADANIRNELQDPNLARVQEEVEQYREFLENTEGEYSEFLIRINADDSEDKIWLDFCDAIEASL